MKYSAAWLIAVALEVYLPASDPLDGWGVVKLGNPPALIPVGWARS